VKIHIIKRINESYNARLLILSNIPLFNITTADGNTGHNINSENGQSEADDNNVKV
jgi:hypothetical protein